VNTWKGEVFYRKNRHYIQITEKWNKMTNEELNDILAREKDIFALFSK